MDVEDRGQKRGTLLWERLSAAILRFQSSSSGSGQVNSLIFIEKMSYMAYFNPKNDDIGAENSYFWKSNQIISMS